MSVEQPDALALLDIARATLLEQLLPELEGNARYQALMIANALAMAMRELTPGTVDLEAQAGLLHGLYQQMQPPDDGNGSEHDGADSQLDARSAEARFARDLRSGELDGDAQDRVRKLLRMRIEARLAVSNPRRLAREAKARERSSAPAPGALPLAGRERTPGTASDVD